MTSPASSRTAGAGAGADAERIDALDGVRAVAVLAVLGYHVRVPGMSAGFLGVDAFFVLSGFLITGLLLHDIGRHGRVRLGVFWTRRVRRLMPAFLLVIAAVLVWGATLAPGYQRDALREDAIMSLLYLGNWHFIETTSYFADNGVASPLQHVWSLAVEEQFYILWPLLVAGAALALRRLTGWRAAAPTGSPAIVAVFALAVLGSVGSVALLSALHDPLSPERAYMGTDARAFEPLLGAALAAAMTYPGLRSWLSRHSRPLLTVGLAGFVAGVVLLGSGTGDGANAAYFHGGALAVSLACVLLVAAAATDTAGHGPGRLLAAAPVAGLGRISYGVYLWHWPLVIWLLPQGAFQPVRAGLVVALSIVAAWLSYVLVEMPIRRGRAAAWLAPRRLVPVVALALGTGISSAHAFVQTPEPGRNGILLVGDSVLNRMFTAVAAEQEARGGEVVTAAVGRCPALGVGIAAANGGAFSTGIDCRTVPARQAEAVREVDPTVVVWWSRYELADRLAPDGRKLAAGTPEFWAAHREDLREAVDRLTRGGAELVFVRTDRPGVGIAERCRSDGCAPFLRRLVEDDHLRVRWNAEIDRLAVNDPRVHVLDMEDTYCRDNAVPCDDRLPDGTLARPDGSHFGEHAAPGVAATLLDRVEAAVADG